MDVTVIDLLGVPGLAPCRPARFIRSPGSGCGAVNEGIRKGGNQIEHLGELIGNGSIEMLLTQPGRPSWLCSLSIAIE